MTNTFFPYPAYNGGIFSELREISFTETRDANEWRGYLVECFTGYDPMDSDAHLRGRLNHVCTPLLPMEGLDKVLREKIAAGEPVEFWDNMYYMYNGLTYLLPVFACGEINFTLAEPGSLTCNTPETTWPNWKEETEGIRAHWIRMDVRGTWERILKAPAEFSFITPDFKVDLKEVCLEEGEQIAQCLWTGTIYDLEYTDGVFLEGQPCGHYLNHYQEVPFTVFIRKTGTLEEMAQQVLEHIRRCFSELEDQVDWERECREEDANAYGHELTSEYLGHISMYGQFKRRVYMTLEKSMQEEL
jgi:hypothetical protein